MGWTSTNKKSYETIDEFFERELGNNNIEWVGKGSLVNFHHYYRLYHVKESNNYYIVTILVHFSKDSYFNISFKVMDETMMPYIYDCPKRILDMADSLSSEISEEAKAYRKNCRDYHARNKALKEHTLIKFANNIDFYNGYSGQYFVVGKRKSLYFFDTEAKKIRFQSTIRNWKERDFEIVNENYHNF